MTEAESETNLAEESSECIITETLSSQESPNQIEESCTSSNIYSFKLVGDNIDFTIKARYNRVDNHKNQSLHYFHYMSVCDRINFNHLSITKPHMCLNSANKIALLLLPSKKCDNRLIRDLAVLVSQIIVSYMPYFHSAFSDVVTWHIEHDYYKEMSRKSQVVSCLYLHGQFAFTSLFVGSTGCPSPQ